MTGSSSSCSRTSGPGPSGCASSPSATGCRSSGRSAAASRHRRARHAARRRRDRDRAAASPSQEAWGGRALLGFRDADHAPAPALFADPAVATDDGSVGHHGLVTELLERELDARAAAGLRVRAAGDAGRGPRARPAPRACRPSSRSRRRWPAASAPATAASSRPSTATGACASTARCSTARCSRDRVLRLCAAPPGDQRLGLLRRARRAARVRRRAAARSSRSPPTCRRRSRSRRARATRRRGCGRRRPA